ncbi:protein kinase [Streptomyces sp. NPDC060366]|uniref:protein kinase domain-containing protein n=1 Tax=Streptomyces sp. NPDC060366 TaxID=3347105 RepID=UPI0036631B38
MRRESLAVSVPYGFRVGAWEVREPIGSGAFGSVYAARRTTDATDAEATATGTGTGTGTPGDPGDDALPSHAALKFLPTGTRTPRQLRHLQELTRRELETYRRLKRPRLIRMYEALTVSAPESPELDGATVLVLERAEGSLETLLSRAPRPAAGPALLAQICEGLHQLHHAGWVHGDIKPGNVLLMADGTARLGDFNLAAELDGTHAYSPMFTTSDYTPPELLWSEINERGLRTRPSTDIWAFGVLAHLVLTDTLPLPGATRTARKETLLRYARGEEELRLSPELTGPWREIVTDCLARTHEERAAHGAASLLRRAERAAGTSRAPRLPRLRPRPPARPRAGLAVTTAAAVLGAAAVLALRDPPPHTSAYGYERCPAGSACFFSERNGEGEMCSWTNDDMNWLTGEETCSWTRDRPVKSVFNNDRERKRNHALAYFWEPEWKPRPADGDERIGCTNVDVQGNLAGFYAPLSHKWIPSCSTHHYAPPPRTAPTAPTAAVPATAPTTATAP